MTRKETLPPPRKHAEKLNNSALHGDNMPQMSTIFDGCAPQSVELSSPPRTLVE